MTQWQLFPAGTVPEFTTLEFFENHGWVPPEHQIGHAERTHMTATLASYLISGGDIQTICDLGCGDGTLMALIKARHPSIEIWGIDGGRENVNMARSKGLDVMQGNILAAETHGVDLVIASEVVEHLLDPHAFIAGIESLWMIITSPAHETKTWHYPHHAWAWNRAGYSKMVSRAGWKIVAHELCDAPPVDHGKGPRAQKYQAIAAQWECADQR